MKKIFILILFFLLCLNLDAKGETTVGTFTPINTFHPPVISVVYPSNGSVDISLNIICYVTIYDVKGDTMNLSFYENTTGSWVLQQTNNSIGNGTYYWNYINSTDYNRIYYWRIVSNDGLNWTNYTYHFRSESHILKADFSYIVTGANIHCTSISSGPPESYKWEISNDSVIFGTTDWINDTSGINQIFTYPDGGTICIKLYVTGFNQSDWIMKCIGSMNSSKDIYPPEKYYNCKACEDAGYYWYNNSCHEKPKTDPWNEKTDLPEAKIPTDIYMINLGEWKIDSRFLLVIFILGLLVLLVFKRNKEKKKKKNFVND